ncbi:SdrD B-like domain-containing protein [Variovorax sp. KK3]|uniref:SdrD B-like domain-containing protein n=1 Tax=Variovorax sp. KK3 TaxID=1855728 RepID=UPI00097C4511|nr:SdrD B-like domain-containing protein [Variovorax sp. KK3]
MQTQPALAEGGDYVDRVLDDSPQQARLDDEPARIDTGWPRGWSVEAQSTHQSGLVRQNTQSLLFSGYLDTPGYGTFSANASLNRDAAPVSGLGFYNSTGLPTTVVPYSYRNGSTWRIDQRSMPFDGGWFGHNSVGNINMATTPLARGLGRVYMPALPIEGVSATLERPGRTTINASAGRLGYFDGLNFQGFSAGRGSAASAGAQTQLTGAEDALALNRTDAAVQVIETRDFNANGVPGYAQNTRSIWSAVSWQGLAPWADSLGSGFGNVADKVGGMRVQANIARSEGRPSGIGSLAPRDAGTGAWVDAAWRGGLMQQAASVFYFEPSLRWGGDQLPSDLRGASWRGDISTRQWQLGANVELSDSVSGLRGNSVFGNVFGRWRFDSRDAISGIVAARTGSFAAQSVQLTWEHKSDFGYTQWRTDAAHGSDLRVVRTGVDHAWSVGETQTLSTSLAFEHAREQGVPRRAIHWGVLGTTPLPGGARLDLSVRGSNGVGDNETRFLSANARLSWPLGLGWSFVAQYTAARGQESLNPAVVSALTAATLSPVLVAPSSRSFMVALRYESRAGLASAPIGGLPGSGAGRLEGHVFFDQDNNGRREASEGGVPGVTVVLDRRYVARTDAQGFYSFPQVAAGAHEIELVQDNLPLPWSSAVAPSRRVEVRVRDTVAADFPVQKER